MKGISFIEPTQLYNLLNQVIRGVPCVSNEYYLVLFDARKLEEFTESHIITSRYVPYNEKDGFVFPKNIDYSAVKNLVVIDNRANSINDSTCPGVICSEILWKMGSKYPVKVVKGGYEEFSSLYPFLRSQKFLWTQQEMCTLQAYPIEVEPGFLYIGMYAQACQDEIGKHLKIKAHVNVTKHEDPRFSINDTIQGKNREPVSQLLNVPIEDNVSSSNMLSHFSMICSFIDQHRKKEGKTILIYSDLGISRCAAVALCYLIWKHKFSLKEAMMFLGRCHHSICPNQTLVNSLFEWEVEVLGKAVTKPEDLGFLSYD